MPTFGLESVTTLHDSYISFGLSGLSIESFRLIFLVVFAPFMVVITISHLKDIFFSRNNEMDIKQYEAGVTAVTERLAKVRLAHQETTSKLTEANAALTQALGSKDAAIAAKDAKLAELTAQLAEKDAAIAAAQQAGAEATSVSPEAEADLTRLNEETTRLESEASHVANLVITLPQASPLLASGAE